MRPLKEDFIAQYQTGTIIPVMDEISSDRMNPVDVYYATGACYLLESAEKGSQVGRFSFLGIDPECRFEARGEEVTVTRGCDVSTSRRPDPLSALKEIISSHRYAGSGDLSPFPGGAVGFIGYDAVQRFETIHFDQSKPGIDIPDSVFVVTRTVIVFDHLMHSVRVIVNVRAEGNAEAEYERARTDIEKVLSAISSYRSDEKSSFSLNSPMTSSMTRETFCKAVATIKEEIAAGEAIQVVFSQRFDAAYEGDTFEVYRALRSINPSPYMFYLNFGDFVIIGASPEVMVRAEKGKALLRPIAGTRPRGASEAEDESLKAELLADEKEKAEHIMLVDLARNDLGRIALSGSVNVDRYMEVERYSHVMHIVSEVSAKIAPDADMFDLIRATFPAGTVSGAPKIRAMQIIDRLEPTKRMYYAGLIGYLSYTGTFDSCITIRTLAAKDGRIYMQAGAGIVADSVPEKEYEETLHKAGAVFSALEQRRI